MILGKYIRLSSQDDDCRPGEKAESNSIVNQRSLLSHYIASHPDLAGCRALEFIDDGHTGFNFDRPGVQALFSAVKRGEINCIIVKDLSRFGRNSLEVGEYLERIFPLLNVRFIAVNDGLDTKTKAYGVAGDLDVGARNIINEFYSRTVSTNVRTAKRQHAARGEFISAYPFYGYVKGASNRRQLEIDPPAADTVCMIFHLWLEGFSREDIAARLNAQDIPSPSMRKLQLGTKRTNWSKLRENVPWTGKSVRFILRNEQYTGKLISLRSTRKEIGSPEQRAIPKENWIVVPNAFEPIISEDVFQKAQTLFKTTRQSTKQKSQHTQHLFSNIALCGVCGVGLHYRKARPPFYKCRAAKGPLQARCLSIHITEEDLRAYVLSEIQDRIAAFSYKTEEAGIPENADAFQAQIHALERKIEKQWSAKKDAFVRWSDGLISKDEYRNICAEKQQKIQRLHGEIEKLSGVTIGHRDDESYTRLSDVKELTRDMLDTLVQAVYVFDDGHIEIEWKDHTAAEDIIVPMLYYSNLQNT